MIARIALPVALVAISLLPVSRARADDPEARQFLKVDETGQIKFKTTPDEKSVPKEFHLENHSFKFETDYERKSGDVRVFRVRFPSPVETDSQRNNTVYGHYFQPSGEGPFPGVVVLHILGGEFPLSQMVANSLAQAKTAALFIKMPYYGERRDPKSSRRMISDVPEETVEGMRQAVLDIRRAAAWIAARPEVDRKQLGVTGISLGGIMSGLSAAGEPRFRKVAIYLGGGNLAATLWEMPGRKAVAFRREWRAQGKSRDDLIRIMKPVDPATWGHLLRDRHVLMVNAKSDEIISRDATLALWNSIGTKPELVWLDAGHVGAARYIFSELERMRRFFAADEKGQTHASGE